MKTEDEFVRNLVAAGALASLSGLHENAQKIFEGLRILRPQNDVDASIGLTIAKINANQFDDAVRILQDRVLKIDPKNVVAKCFLGVAFKFLDRDREANKLFQEVLELASEENINEKKLATEFLKDETI